ncbi:hypothetical protein OEZ86_009294 [Tetradesmus obliquus]|nr:hypothetical protein OEZ86_009294 [Tetradesmus obliquus]
MVTVASRRAAEVALDCASQMGIAIAEQPRRMKEFQDEVQAVAERELQSSSRQPGLLASSSSGSSSSSSSSSSTSSSSAAANKDLEAIVDELRADIAASRALLQQIKTGDMGPLGPTTSSSKRSGA